MAKKRTSYVSGDSQPREDSEEGSRPRAKMADVGGAYTPGKMSDVGGAYGHLMGTPQDIADHPVNQNESSNLKPYQEIR